MRFQSVSWCVLMALVCGLSLNGMVRSQTDLTTQNVGQLDFDALRTQLGPFEAAASVNRSRLVAAWMDATDWRALTIQQQRQLIDGLDADQLSFPIFSVRWTGQLTSPLTDRYTFFQCRQHLREGTMRVWIDGKLVLDSSQPNEDAPDAPFQSQPIHLTAGDAVSFQVEYSHSYSGPIHYSQGAPMAVLAWQSSAQAKPQIVPAEVFTPPADFRAAGNQGLKGEYVSGAVFNTGDIKATRLDAAVDFVWPWEPVIPLERSKFDEALSACRDKLLDGQHLSSLPAAERVLFLDQAAWQLCHRLALSQRRQYVLALTQRPELLQAMSPYAMGKLMESIYMLPGKEHLDLLRAWSTARPQPRTTMGESPGWGIGTYQTNNLEFYWLIGTFLKGHYFTDAETLMDTDLQFPNGDCNLAIGYVTAFAAHDAKREASFRTRVQNVLDQNNLAGDSRATWLLARAFSDEVMVAGVPRLTRGMESLQEAILVANTPPYRFWMLSEQVARLGSLGDAQQVQTLIEQYQDEFSSAAQQATMSQWKQRATDLATLYEQRGAVRDDASQQAYVETLKRRKALAEANGDSAAAARYGLILQNAEAELTDN